MSSLAILLALLLTLLILSTGLFLFTVWKRQNKFTQEVIENLTNLQMETTKLLAAKGPLEFQAIQTEGWSSPNSLLSESEEEQAVTGDPDFEIIQSQYADYLPDGSEEISEEEIDRIEQQFFGAGIESRFF